MNWRIIREIRSKLGREQGAILKDWGGRIHIALIYPNSYSLGMSNLGFQLIYGFLNQYDHVVCERVFFGNHEPLSMESQRPLGDFDVIAFSFSYEPDYFNAATILKSSGIPVSAADRGEQHPLIIAGGAAVTANPEPLASLIDCFAIGEGEAILPQMTQVLLDGFESPRHELLQALAKVQGIYVPNISNSVVDRQWTEDLGNFDTRSVVLTPETELGDLYLMEIARGCPWRCRFCLAGFHFHPVRHRPIEKLLGLAKEGLRYRKRIGLVSAAISDHPQIDELVTGLRMMGADFSVSSLRMKPLSDTVLCGLAESGTRTVSLAPEAGSQRLRQFVKKGISEDDILYAIDRIAVHGIKQIKLYFLIGLPTEEDEDIVDIANLSIAAKNILNKHRSGIHLTLNVTPFVPKAGTPFQWLPMATSDVLKRRLSLLRKKLARKGIEVKADSIDWSLVQGMLSRGDHKIGYVIAGIPRVSLSAWHKSLEKVGVDSGLIHRKLPTSERLPWSTINSGVGFEHLRAELELAFQSRNLKS